jgi:uridine kinase
MNSEYFQEYTENLNKVKQALQNGKNIIICGPEKSGKTKMRLELKEFLNDYDVFCGAHDYHYRNRSNGRHYANNKFWIEEINKNLVNNILEDYEFIETNLQYQFTNP